MAYQFMKTNWNRYTVRETAGLLEVNRSAYYKWFRNGVSQRRKSADTELVRLIREISVKNHLRYARNFAMSTLPLLCGKTD
jgi:hypothetical protein